MLPIGLMGGQFLGNFLAGQYMREKRREEFDLAKDAHKQKLDLIKLQMQREQAKLDKETRFQDLIGGYLQNALQPEAATQPTGGEPAQDDSKLAYGDSFYDQGQVQRPTAAPMPTPGERLLQRLTPEVQMAFKLAGHDVSGIVSAAAAQERLRLQRGDADWKEVQSPRHPAGWMVMARMPKHGGTEPEYSWGTLRQPEPVLRTGNFGGDQYQWWEPKGGGRLGGSPPQLGAGGSRPGLGGAPPSLGGPPTGAIMTVPKEGKSTVEAGKAADLNLAMDAHEEAWSYIMDPASGLFKPGWRQQLFGDWAAKKVLGDNIGQAASSFLTPDGAKYTAMMLHPLSVKLRAETGANMPQKEIENTGVRFAAQWYDDEVILIKKKQLMENYLKGSSEMFDPKKNYGVGAYKIKGTDKQGKEQTYVIKPADPTGLVIDQRTAMSYLQATNGDRKKAEQLARQAGFIWPER